MQTNHRAIAAFSFSIAMPLKLEVQPLACHQMAGAWGVSLQSVSGRNKYMPRESHSCLEVRVKQRIYSADLSRTVRRHICPMHFPLQMFCVYVSRPTRLPRVREVGSLCRCTYATDRFRARHAHIPTRDYLSCKSEFPFQDPSNDDSEILVQVMKYLFRFDRKYASPATPCQPHHLKMDDPVLNVKSSVFSGMNKENIKKKVFVS